MQVIVYNGFGALPAEYKALLRVGENRSFYLGLPWFKNLVETTTDGGDDLRLYGVEDGDAAAGPLALFVARARGRGPGRISPRTLAAFTTLYTTEYDLILAPGLARSEPVIEAIVQAIKADEPSWELFEIKALAQEGRTLAEMVAALRRHGFAVAPYRQFGSWYARTDNLSYAEYAGSLPKGLRQLRKKLDRPGGPRFDLVTSGPDVERAIAIYQQLYLESWKEPEPYPHFTPGLIRAAASAGALRFGLLHIDNEPAAAQLWIVAAGRASIFKVVHAERFKRMSPGSILTGRLMEHVIEIDKVSEVDFGRGDDDYKKMWLPRQREFWGILAYNPRTLRGAIGGLRDVVLARLARRGREFLRQLRVQDARSGDAKSKTLPGK